MAEAILKILTDSAWYFAFIAPIVAISPSPVSIILLALPALWAVYVAVFWKKRDFISDASSIVLFEARFLLAIGILEILFLGPARWQACCGRPVLLFLIFGIFLLRAGRIAGASGEKRGFWGASGVSLLAALCTAAVFSSKAVQKAVIWLLSTTYNHLVIPVLEGLFWLLANVLSAIISLFLLIFSGGSQEEAQENLLLSLDNSLELEELGTSETPLAAKIIGTLILILAAAAVLFFLYRKLSGHASQWGKAIPGSVTRSRDDEKKGNPQKRWFFYQERNVRYYYRKFLRICVKSGLNTEQPLTTTEVDRFSETYLGKKEESEELKNLYQLVRYGGKAESSEQKNIAKELYQNLTKGMIL